MLSDDEVRFISWWEQHRHKEKKWLKQWLIGLPLGLSFGLAILINFFSGWYKRADMIFNSQVSNRNFNPLVLVLAMLLIVSFVAIFSKRHKWEMNEQKYKELKARTDSGKVEAAKGE
ncbi:MAG: hypothetical protein WKF97_23950 [Chitinophagaceae bacterium]